ncbi:ABC transporter permease [Streptomyces sp. N50]|uniref:ABC transporter permease n=1 Tax=Streptomyces sp. N50 TaxID=3081765 RepID=UPI00296230C6|nr:ABC transporter permease [Streptomyces sp. N50]WOX15488.1 ABC transporter permease [Streptomyces sp. N50]
MALVLGVALIGVSGATLAATWAVPQPAAAGQSVTLRDGSGTRHTLVGGTVDMGGVQSVLAIAGVISAFVTVFVIAGTCAFSVALRRRDMGLLRLVGAQGAQVRRLVIGECAAMALPAGLVGCAAAAVAAPWAVRGINGTGLSPVELTLGPLVGPLVFAACAGLVIAVLGALAASRRAARVGPTEALREADLDSQVMTLGRSCTGGFLLLTGLAMVMLAPGAGAEAATPLALFGTMALTLAAALLGPAYLPRLIRVLLTPLKWTRSIPVRLALAAVSTSRRRTASLVGPVLSIVAIVGIFTSVMATTGAAGDADERHRTVGQLVVEPLSGEGLAPDLLARLRAAPGVRAVSAPASLELAVAGPYSVWQEQGAVADLAALAQTHHITVVEGTATALRPGTVAVSKEFADWYGYHEGSRLTYGLYGGEPATARVATVLDGGAVVPHVVLPMTAVAEASAPTQATVLLDAAAARSPGAAATRLADRLGPDRVRVTTAVRWFDGAATEQERLNRLVLLVLTGPACAYALIAVASTLVMSYSRRSREVAGLRVIGTSRTQLLRMALWETLTTTAVGAGVAAVIVGMGLWAYRSALHVFGGTVPVSVPWTLLLSLVGACLAVAVTVGQITIRRLLKQGSIAALTARQ